MKLINRKEDNREKELTTGQKEDLFNAIVRGKDAIETIHTSRGDFKVKFPRMKDLESIGRLVAYRLNGLSAQSFDQNTYSLIQQIATLDIIVVEGPAWFENAKNENPNGLSWGDMPSQAFIQEVYALAYEFRLKMSQTFELDKETKDTGLAANNNTDVPSQSGLFEGLSGKS